MDGSFEVVKASPALYSTRVDSSVLRASFWSLTVFPLLHEILHTLVGQVLVEPLIVNLDHRCIHTRTQALHLLQSKQAILRSFIQIDVSEILDGLDDILGLLRVRISYDLRHEGDRE